MLARLHWWLLRKLASRGPWPLPGDEQPLTGEEKAKLRAFCESGRYLSLQKVIRVCEDRLVRALVEGNGQARGGLLALRQLRLSLEAARREEPSEAPSPEDDFYARNAFGGTPKERK